MTPNSTFLVCPGTASIVGHESRHIGDVAAQTHEALDNVANAYQRVGDYYRAQGELRNEVTPERFAELQQLVERRNLLSYGNPWRAKSHFDVMCADPPAPY